MLIFSSDRKLKANNRSVKSGCPIQGNKSKLKIRLGRPCRLIQGVEGPSPSRDYVLLKVVNRTLLFGYFAISLIQIVVLIRISVAYFKEERSPLIFSIRKSLSVYV